MFCSDVSIDSRECCAWIFFFQAEDGIRDLVRSRGLGDVYKRQVHDPQLNHIGLWVDDLAVAVAWLEQQGMRFTPGAVSYTHLTLPTSDLV